MIKLIDKIDYEKCKTISLYDPFMGKIRSELEVNSGIYEMHLYEQTDSKGNVTCIMLNYSSNVTVFALDNADLNEIKDFLNALCFYSVLSNTALPLECSQKHGDVMKYCGKLHKSKLSTKVSSEEVKNIFPLICDNFEYADDFSMWYCDVSHKVRHKCAFAVGIKKDD